MEGIELQSDIQLEKKFIQVSLLDTLSKEKYSAVHENVHALFMVFLLGSMYLYSRADFSPFRSTQNIK